MAKQIESTDLEDALRIFAGTLHTLEPFTSAVVAEAVDAMAKAGQYSASWPADDKAVFEPFRGASITVLPDGARRSMAIAAPLVALAEDRTAADLDRVKATRAVPRTGRRP